MIRSRFSGTTTANPHLRHQPARRGERNLGWIARTRATDGIILLGGTSLGNFRSRVAQSHLRGDLLPSFWSLAGILHDNRVETVPFEWPDASAIPRANAVRSLPLRAFDDPERYPNVAIVRFVSEVGALRTGIRRVKAERSIVDLPRLLLAWLAFEWGANEHGNPLLAGLGHPSAAFVEAVHAIADVELTPGLSSDASCPEAIWLSAKWWRTYYEDTATEERPYRLAPSGFYVTRQRAAAVRDPRDKQK